MRPSLDLEINPNAPDLEVGVPRTVRADPNRDGQSEKDLTATEISRPHAAEVRSSIWVGRLTVNSPVEIVGGNIWRVIGENPAIAVPDVNCLGCKGLNIGRAVVDQNLVRPRP